MWHLEGFSMMPLGTVVSDDIWKKFDMDLLHSSEGYVHVNFSSFDIIPESFDDTNCSNYPEIRHHDCMWAGLCISKEHNKILSNTNQRISPPIIIPAGKSLLKSRSSSDSMDHPELFFIQNQHQRMDSLESDGGSPRSESPQTSSESSEGESDSERDIPTFKHDHFSINEKLMECISAPVSEVTGQCVRSSLKIKVEVNETSHDESIDARNNTNTSKQTEVSNTLIDHCYYINHPTSIKKLDYLGVQTPSDSEEEIDVVSFEKSASFDDFGSLVDQKMTKVLYDKPASRPRGRPPNASRKRPAQNEEQEQIPAKRAAVQRSCQKKITNVPKNISSPISIPTNTEKYIPPVTVASDDEPDVEKRNLHNNMERQRRIELRNAFEGLRCLIPDLQIKDKAPKVAILRQGGKYCMKLRESEKKLIAQKLELKKRQDKLRTKLSLLRRCLAKQR
ncbi:bHLH transcription factor Myc [Cotesia typhae]|uniref:bHLH transcription factor Myc n=1 Tax=Cotesia typhae TaxID=2053667 RepID=UPI003D6902F2